MPDARKWLKFWKKLPTFDWIKIETANFMVNICS